MFNYEVCKREVDEKGSSVHPKTKASVDIYMGDLKALEKAGKVAKLAAGDEIEVIDFYSSDTSRMGRNLVPYTSGKYSIDNTQYFYRVRVKTGKYKGRVFFMYPYHVAEPRPKVPGEPTP